MLNKCRSKIQYILSVNSCHEMVENIHILNGQKKGVFRALSGFFPMKRLGYNLKKWLFLCWVLVFPGNIFAQALLITGADNGPPKYFIENGNTKGFIVDITRWVLEDMGYPHKIRLYPWKRAYRYALDGEAAIIGLSISSQRLTLFDYSNPLFYGDLMVVVKEGHEFEFNSIADLAGKRIAVSRGASYGDAFNEAVIEGVFEIEEYSRSANVLHMILNNRGVDALIIGPGKYGLAAVVDSDDQLRMEQFTMLPVPFKRDAKYLGIAKTLQMKPFIKKFNESLKKAWDRGVVDRLVDKYFK